MSADLEDLQRQLNELRAETRANAGTISSSIRKSRLGLVVAEHDENVRRLAPPTFLLDWHPRPGTPTDPSKVQGGLIDRLRNASPVADTLGNATPIPGQSNLLDEPAFESYSESLVTVLTTDTTIGVENDPVAQPVRTWVIRKAAGSTGTCTSQAAAERTLQATDPFNSTAIMQRIVPIAGAATNEIQLDSNGVAIGGLPTLPYVVCSIRVARMAANVYTNVTSRTLTIEVLDTTDGVARATRTVDLSPLSDTVKDSFQVYVAMDYSALTALQQGHSFGLRARLTVVSSGAGGDVTYWLGEPLMHFSRSPDPIAYTPAIAGWVPRMVAMQNAPAATSIMAAGAVSGDSWTRFRMTVDGLFRWGSGAAAPDIRIFRNGAGNIGFDSDSSAVATVVDVRSTVGQLSSLRGYIAGDSFPRTQMRSDTVQGLYMGPGNVAADVRLLRNGVKQFQIDDTAGGAADLNVTGVLKQAGTGVSVIGHGAADHVDLTRRLWLPAHDALLMTGTLATVGVVPDQAQVVALADAATQGCGWVFNIPVEWASGVITIQPVWAPGANDAVAHTVRWSYDAKTMGAGISLAAGGAITAWTGSSAARTANALVYDTATSTGVTPGINDSFRFVIQRIGADAADTYVGVVNLLGVIVIYTANQ